MAAILTLSYLTLLSGACAQSGRDDRVLPEGQSGLSLRFVDPHRLLAPGASAAASEITRIFEALGVRVRFDNDDTIPSTPSGAPLRIVLLPSAPSGPGWRLAPNALGVTVGDGVATAPAVYVFYPRLLRAVDVPDRKERLPSGLELRRLTRALGRVVAHEIFHALAPGQPHAETGLMSAELSSELLVGEQPSIDPRWARLLRRGIEERATSRVLQ